MHSIKQLLRQPGKAVFGILLVAMAVSVLVVCLGQRLAAWQTEKQLAYDFSTVAVHPAVMHKYTDKRGNTYVKTGLSEDMKAWVEQVVAQNPEMVKMYSQTGFASAYIPQLQADHYTEHGADPAGFALGQYNLPQDMAMFVVTVEQIGEFEERTSSTTHYYTDPLTGQETTVKEEGILDVTVTLRTRIDQVVSLADIFTDPTGWPLELTVRTNTWEQMEAIGLQVGQQYMVSGSDYYDNSHLIGTYINQMRQFQGLAMDQFDEKNLHFLTDEEKTLWLQHHNHKRAPDVIYGDKKYITQDLPTDISPVTGQSRIDPSKIMMFDLLEGHKGYDGYLEKYRTARMSVWDSIQEERKTLTAQGLEVQLWRYVIREGEKVKMDLEEYLALYSVPTMTKLTTSVEQFLENNPLWADALGYQQVNHHVFPVYAVDHLDYIVEFNRGSSRIVQGRAFTQEEMETGAQVCVISEVLAQKNGLQVGDSVTSSFFAPDYSVPYQHLPSGGNNMEALSVPAYYFAGSQLQTPQTYTVVGIYRQGDVWEDYANNHFSFSPNAIFVPKASLDVAMDYSELGLFKVLVLENGAYPAFDAIITSREFPEWADYIAQDERNLFVYSDQGYLSVSQSLVNYQALGNQVTVVGMAVYCVVLLLFLLLYPGMMGKQLWTMATMGACRKKKFTHVVVSALGILVPGTLLGALLGLGLWGLAVGFLLTFTQAAFSLTLDLTAFGLILAAQLALSVGAVSLLALPMTKQKNLMKKK